MTSSSRAVDYYMRYLGGPDRDWEECRRYGFMSGSGHRPVLNLRIPKPGDRVWVYAPKYEAKHGYVGVGIVAGEPGPLVEFEVKDEKGEVKRLVDLPTTIAARSIHALSPLKAEHAIAIDWLKTVPIAEAVFKAGFFTNQNFICLPKVPSWGQTLDMLRGAFGIE